MLDAVVYVLGWLTFTGIVIFSLIVLIVMAMLTIDAIKNIRKRETTVLFMRKPMNMANYSAAMKALDCLRDSGISRRLTLDEAREVITHKYLILKDRNITLTKPDKDKKK